MRSRARPSAALRASRRRAADTLSTPLTHAHTTPPKATPPEQPASRTRSRYKPHTIEFETKMKPFIPNYFPAVQEMETFLKAPRSTFYGN